MSRADKRIHRERVVGTAKDESVRLFAFANTRPGYQVCFSPEQPIIILKTKKQATGQHPQHPCAQWEPFSDLVFNAHPNTTHAVYVADTTALSAKVGLEQEEVVSGPAVGRTLRQLGNAVARLNPHNATLVAAGVSAHLALKYMLVGEKTLGHRDRLVARLLLVCPASLDELIRLTDAVAHMQRGGTAREQHYPKPSVTVLVKGGRDAAAAYEKWLSTCSSLFVSTSVETDLNPSLFAAIARHAMVDGGAPMANSVGQGEGGVDTNSRFEQPRVYRIDFVLSKASKTVEQFPVLSPLDTTGIDDDTASNEAAEEDDDEEGEEEDDEEEDTCDEAAHGHGHAHGHSHGDGADCGSCCQSDDAAGADDEGEGSCMYVAGVASLQQWKEPVRIMLEGRVLNLAAGLVGTTEGCVTVEGLADLVSADESLSKLAEEKQRKKKGSLCVALATRLLRDECGRTTLKALEVRAMTRQEERRSMTVGSSPGEIPLTYNVSAIAYSYGAVLVRGRKCALVRDLDAEGLSGRGHGKPSHPADLFLPHQPLVDSRESGMDCAIRALCEACEVSSDNFYCPSYVSPVVYYTTDEDDRSVTRCVTLFIALAVNPPPRGPASDAREDQLDPKERYDWVSFDKALSVLTTEDEKTALREVVQALRKAAKAGLYKTFPGCGLFGDAVQGASSAVAASAGVSASPSVSLDGTVELVAVLCPGCRAVPDALATAVQAALGVPGIHTFDAKSNTASLEAAAEDAVRAGRPTLAVFLNQDAVDVNDFCEDQLFDLLSRRGLKSRLVTVLTRSACEAVATLDGDLAERSALMQSLLSAARVSDVLCLAEAPPFADAGAATTEHVLWALLACCAEANPDLTILRGWQSASGGASQRISPEDIDAMAAEKAVPASALTSARVFLTESNTPVAPAALAFLANPSSLSVFNVSGESFLLAMEGVTWVATRPATQGLVSLNHGDCCLEVEGGDDWRAVKEQPHSTLRLHVLCASEAVAERVRATAAQLFQQLLWNCERDGKDVKALMDPLPSWEN